MKVTLQDVKVPRGLAYLEDHGSSDVRLVVDVVWEEGAPDAMIKVVQVETGEEQGYIALTEIETVERIRKALEKLVEPIESEIGKVLAQILHSDKSAREHLFEILDAHR